MNTLQPVTSITESVPRKGMKALLRMAQFRLALAAAGLLFLFLGSGVAATLQDFGYQNMRVNSVLPTGQRPLLVILANFAGRPTLTNSAAYYDDFAFNPARVPSLNGYFKAMSHSRFSWSRGGIIGPLSLGANETDNNFVNNDLFVSNIVHKAMGMFNFAAYDANHDGRVSSAELGILVINSYFTGMRSVRGDVRPPGSPVGWYGPVGLVGQDANFGVCCEEFEETLGCQDLYGAGCLSQGLTFQSCNPGRTNMVYLDPWHRMQLGWSEGRIRSLTNSELTANIFLIGCGRFNYNDREFGRSLAV